MPRWRVKKAKHPADPARPWMAYPGTAVIRASRYPDWRSAYRHAYERTH